MELHTSASPHAPGPEPAATLIREGRSHQLAGRLREAAESFAGAVDLAQPADAVALRAEALRLLGIIHHLQGETITGLAYCQRSRSVATGAGAARLAAEATIAAANMACEQGRMSDAVLLYGEALTTTTVDPDLMARVQQNLGIVESVRGDYDSALQHYQLALQAYDSAGDLAGRAMVYHNIGMICADQKQWSAATRAYNEASELARHCGNRHLEALCLLNRAEVDIAHDRLDAARRQAEAALAIFAELGARVDVAAAYRMLGVVFRAQKQTTLAESRLLAAVEISSSAGAVLAEAEACSELGLLYADDGRVPEAIEQLGRALALFTRLGAAAEVTRVTAQRERLRAA